MTNTPTVEETAEYLQERVRFLSMHEGLVESVLRKQREIGRQEAERSARSRAPDGNPPKPKCARCGEHHVQPTHRFKGGPIDVGGEVIVAWSFCPYINEPIFYNNDMLEDHDE